MSIYLKIYTFVKRNSRVSKCIISYKRNVFCHKIKQYTFITEYFSYDNYVIEDNYTHVISVTKYVDIDMMSFKCNSIHKAYNVHLLEVSTFSFIPHFPSYLSAELSV